MPHPSRILSTQLRTAREMWSDLDPETSGPLDRWLAAYFFRRRKILGSRDRRFLSEILYALFRHYSLLEAWADQFSCGSREDLMVLLAAALEDLIPLDVFLHEIAPMGIQQEDAEKLYVHLKQRKTPVSQKPRSTLEQLSLQYSFPAALLERWQKLFSAEELPKVLESFNERPPLCVRTNPLKISREQLIEKFQAAGFKVAPTPKSPAGILFEERVAVFQTPEFQDGLFEVQDEGSQLAGLLVEAKPGELIWDACAGGGGKTLLMAGSMQNKGRIVATDIRMKKLDDLKKRAQRAGIFNIFPADLNRMDEIKAARDGFDKILVDAPCSGSGTLRRNPDAKWKLGGSVFQKQHEEQVQIVDSVLPRLKPGGRLVYVTCSIDPAENEETVAAILQKHPELTPGKNPLPYGIVPDRPELLKLMPHRDGTDGFFAAVLQKKPA